MSWVRTPLPALTLNLIIMKMTKEQLEMYFELDEIVKSKIKK